MITRNVNVIVAIQHNDNGIAFKGNQLYSFKEYFENLQKLTMNGSVIMGRKTWEAITEKLHPLEQRLNIVITSNINYPLPEGVLRASSYKEAKRLARKNKPDGQIWNIGGDQLYQQAVRDYKTFKLFITRIYGAKPCDTFFPKKYDQSFEQRGTILRLESEDEFDKQQYSFVFEEWQRV